MNNNSKISENLKKFRQQLKLTQGDVAGLINKDRSSIAKYESGAAQPSFAVLRSLAKLYGVETRALNQAVKRNIERFPNNFMLNELLYEDGRINEFLFLTKIILIKLDNNI